MRFSIFSIVALLIAASSSDAAPPQQKEHANKIQQKLRRNKKTQSRKNINRNKRSLQKNNHSSTFNKDHRLLADQVCLESWTLFLEDGCEIDVLVEELEILLEDVDCSHGVNKELKLITGEGTTSRAINSIVDACTSALTANSLEFDEIGENNNVWTKAFFDGDTSFNYERQTKDNNGETIYRLKDSPGADIQNIQDGVATFGVITWPGEEAIPNFDECEIRAAMCCWVQDRQANDDNGGCEKPYDANCIDEDPADNTDICYVNMERAPTSSRTGGGFAIFPGESEGDAHCHGFAWSEDTLSPSNLYKGNNLFYVSMYDHLYQRGYVKNVPGAPMCACVEQMPVVSRSDCTQIVMEANLMQVSFSGGSLSVVAQEQEIIFEACEGLEEDNDLASHYDLLVEEGIASVEERNILGETVVGEDNCEDAISAFLSELI